MGEYYFLGDRQRDSGVLLGDNSSTRGTGSSIMQQRSSNIENGFLHARTIPQCQIHFHGTRRPCHSSFHHLEKGKGISRNSFSTITSQRSPFLGHHYGLRSDVLSSIIDQMESRYFRDVRPMSGGWTRKMFNGTVRTVGITSETMDEEDLKLFGRALERIGDAPRGIY